MSRTTNEDQQRTVFSKIFHSNTQLYIHWKLDRYNRARNVPLVSIHVTFTGRDFFFILKRLRNTKRICWYIARSHILRTRTRGAFSMMGLSVHEAGSHERHHFQATLCTLSYASFLELDRSSSIVRAARERANFDRGGVRNHSTDASDPTSSWLREGSLLTVSRGGHGSAQPSLTHGGQGVKIEPEGIFGRSLGVCTVWIRRCDYLTRPTARSRAFRLNKRSADVYRSKRAKVISILQKARD